MAKMVDADLVINALSAFSLIEMRTGDRTRKVEKSYDINAVTLGYEQGIEDAIAVLHDIPPIDPVKHGYVSKEVLDQIRWERDIAMSYLEEAGIGFGEKAELQRVKHAKWIHPDKEHEFNDLYRCSECYYLGDWRDLGASFCPECGARMNKGV